MKTVVINGVTHVGQLSWGTDAKRIRSGPVTLGKRLAVRIPARTTGVSRIKRR